MAMAYTKTWSGVVEWSGVEWSGVNFGVESILEWSQIWSGVERNYCCCL